MANEYAGPIGKLKKYIYDRIKATTLSLQEDIDVNKERLAEQQVQIHAVNERLDYMLKRMAGDDLTFGALRDRVDVLLDHVLKSDAVCAALQEQIEQIQDYQEDEHQSMEDRISSVAGEISGEITRTQTKLSQTQIEISKLSSAHISLRRSVDEISQLIGQRTVPTALDDDFYHDLEELFRGPQEDIARKMEVYFSYIQNRWGDLSEKIFLDVACGRGEWMDILRDGGVKTYSGIDINQQQVQICLNKGHPVKAVDLFDYLAKVAPGSLDVITGFQIIEHLTFSDLYSMFQLCHIALKPGGLVLFETPNPENLVTAALNFYLDPTHKRPLHKELTKFFLEQAGFGDIDLLPMNPNMSDVMPLPDKADENLTIIAENIERLNHRLYGPQDYAAVGVKLDNI